MNDLQKTVDDLLKKAIEAKTSDDALRFTQAALNAAHTKRALAKLGE